MQFTTNILLALGLTSTALAAPAPTTKAIRQTTSWTITSLARICDAPDTTCTWTFGIDNGTTNIPCAFFTNGSPASQQPGGVTCYNYQVTSAWSGQYGPDNGFTTLSVADSEAGLIIWPGYSDAELEGGVVVPDKSFVPVPV